jgi:hypothetical protein
MFGVARRLPCGDDEHSVWRSLSTEQSHRFRAEIVGTILTDGIDEHRASYDTPWCSYQQYAATN